jgi:mRNA interferase MazF
MTVVCDKGDVAIVPFPFTDLAKAKTRPALTLSLRAVNQGCGQTIFAMITTAARSHWPTDVALSDLAACGIGQPSVVRFKLFTLDNRLVLRRLGSLSDKDRRNVQQMLRSIVGT